MIHQEKSCSFNPKVTPLIEVPQPPGQIAENCMDDNLLNCLYLHWHSLSGGKLFRGRLWKDQSGEWAGSGMEGGGFWWQPCLRSSYSHSWPRTTSRSLNRPRVGPRVKELMIWYMETLWIPGGLWRGKDFCLHVLGCMVSLPQCTVHTLSAEVYGLEWRG